jgi:hypothetical protein
MAKSKLPDFILNQKQAPKGPHHGKHRRPGSQAHSNPAGESGGSAGRAGPYTYGLSPAYSYFTRNATIYSNISDPGVGALDQVQMIEEMWRHMADLMFYGTALWVAPAPTPLPYAGVRVGEIIGHRVWDIVRVKGQWRLCSIAHYFPWEPGATINEVINRGNYARIPILGGIYAFATDQLDPITKADIDAMEFRGFPYIAAYADGRTAAIAGVAIGTVSLWGEVVEHTQGWRAQFAKLRSIDRVIGCATLREMRKEYGFE